MKWVYNSKFTYDDAIERNKGLVGNKMVFLVGRYRLHVDFFSCGQNEFSAFLHGDLNEDIYTKQSFDFVYDGNLISRLNKSLYR
jgi:hypothetical protein